MQKGVIQLETLSCPSCMQKIENAVKGLNGVNQDSLKVLFNASKVKVDFDSETITINYNEKSIEDLGYQDNKSKVKSAKDQKITRKRERIMSEQTFNEVITNHFEKLDLYTTAITRAHGKNHPEAFEVRELFETIS